MLKINSVMEAPKFNELLEQIGKGDQTAFTMLYNEYCEKILYAAFSIVSDRSYAEDISNEVFIKIWNGRNGYVKNPNAWIYKMAKNTALNFYRDNIKKLKNLVPFESVEKSKVTLLSENEAFCLMEFQSMLIDLNETDKEIVIMKLFYSYTYPEIAAELRIAVGTVYARYKSALEKIKELYKKQ